LIDVQIFLVDVRTSCSFNDGRRTMTTTTSSTSCATTAVRPSLRDWFTAADANAAPAGISSSTFVATAAAWDRILLLDGGVSTHLAASQSSNDGDNNTGAFAHKELWSSSLLLTASGRRAVLQGHLDWLHAGCNLLSTVTYQCHYHEATWPNKNGSTVIGKPDDMHELWKHGVQLAAQALVEHQHSASSDGSGGSNKTRRPTFLVASSGCFGAALANGAEYTGDYGPDITTPDLMNFHRCKLRQIMAVASSSSASSGDNNNSIALDCIAIETVPSLAEIKALVQLLSEPEMIELFQDNHVACWISLACGNGECLYDQTPLIQALHVLNALPVAMLPAIGLNCCDFRHLASLTHILVTFLADQQHQQEQRLDGSSTSIGSRAIVLYPNSGEEWDAVAKVFRPKTTTPASTTTAEPIVECLMQVIESVESTWRERTQSTSSTSTKCPPHPLSYSYPRIIVGGCCRTTPTEIAALRVAIDEHLQIEKHNQQQHGTH
jgi:homocysteine S-methyltransferase